MRKLDNKKSDSRGDLTLVGCEHNRKVLRMKSLNQGLILILSSMVLMACQPDLGTSSKVSIRIPTKEEFYRSNKVSALSAVDYNNLCFAVNVKGGLIPGRTSNCDVEKGILKGAVSPGSTIEVDVPYGDNLVFEVYGLLKTGVSSECRAVSDLRWNWPMSKIYLLGKTSVPVVRDPTIIVAVPVSMPQEDNHIIAQNSLPNSCVNATPAVANIGRIPGGGILQMGTQFRAYSRATHSEQSKELVGSQFRIKHLRAVTQ